ncbi:MAG: PilZ domain-containing protein [Myxococcota bacterium]|nr:PilZ domain-containing protein [Myxococcota bacterium]
MGDWDGQDRRKSRRLANDELVSFTLFGRSSGLGQGSNISKGGMRFTAVGCSFQCNELVRVSFNVGQQTVEAVGRVVWIDQRDDITAEVGLEFVRIDPWAARLLEDEERKRSER